MDRRLELAAFVLACAGWLCAILTRIMPMWTVTGDVDNITDSLSLYWDGVWLTWQEHKTGSLHCGFYQSLLSLAGSFRSWKALLTACVVMGAFPVVVYMLGMARFPHRVQVRAAAALVFVLSGLLMLVVMAWTTHATYADLDSDVPLTRAWGAALYSGWIGTALLLAGGGTLCMWCCVRRPDPPQQAQSESAAETEMGDPLFAIHRTTFTTSPYGETTSPI